MPEKHSLRCPDCGGQRLILKYEVAYEYSYVLDGNAPGLKNDADFRSFLYDDRVQTAAEQYILCDDCRRRFPCYIQEARSAPSTADAAAARLPKGGGQAPPRG